MPEVAVLDVLQLDQVAALLGEELAEVGREEREVGLRRVSRYLERSSVSLHDCIS